MGKKAAIVSTPWQYTLDTRRKFNLLRVRNLVQASDDKGLSDNLRKDILRAAVVLLHATVEDVMRSVSRELLPHADANVLAQIPCAVEVGGSPIPKFTLAQIRDKVVGGVERYVKARVKSHLDRTSYNNRADLENACKLIPLDAETAGRLIHAIEPMMKRRHEIVHRSDREDMAEHFGKQKHISKKTVETWVASVQDFLEAVMHEVSHPPKKAKS